MSNAPSLSIRDLLGACPEVASLPSVFHRITEVMKDPYGSAEDLGGIISEDVGLTARMLRLVNSAFYSLPSRVESVPQALAVIGTEQLNDLLLATSILTMFKNVPSGFVTMESFWRHSLACGVISKVLATERRAPNVERFFVAGLLHDVGRLVMFQANPEGSLEVMNEARSREELLHVVEEEMMGYHHALVGRRLLSAWRLPSSLQEIVGYHHNPEGSRRYPVETAIVHVADVIAHGRLMGSSGEPFVPPVSRSAWHRLTDPDSVTPHVLREIDRQYESAVQAMLQAS